MDEVELGAKITLEVVESEDCKGCYFADLDFDINIDCCKNIKCGSSKRKDKKNVIFKLVEE